jgi:RNAse (barnase) inhibitor barstar
MAKYDIFKFVPAADFVKIDKSDAFVMFVSTGITNKQLLLDNFYNKLNFPDYFGFNWDALFECLRDLSWMNEKVVMIIHKDLPLLTRKERKTYLDILADACLFWKEHEIHDLEAIFTKELREDILNLAKK